MSEENEPKTNINIMDQINQNHAKAEQIHKDIGIRAKDQKKKKKDK